MPSVKLIQNQEATTDIQQIFENMEQERGMVQPIFRALANFPEYLKATIKKMKTVMAPGKLDAKTKMLIAFTTSVNSGSDMCINNHTKQLKKMGITDEELIEAIAVIDVVNGLNKINTGLRIFPQEQ